MNEMRIFRNEELGLEVRCTVIDGKEYFVAKDIAEALGYVKSRNAISTHCKHALKRGIPTNGGIQDVTLIPEGDMYRLIIRSKLDSAQKFESWVMDEVIPQIRKTGGYIPVSEEDDEKTILAKALKIQQKTLEKKDEIINQKNMIIEQQKPLVEFATTVQEKEDGISMSKFASILNIEGFGRNKLYAWLRANDYLKQDNDPYRRWIEQGLFRVIERITISGDLYNQVLVTGKGQVYIANKLKSFMKEVA